MTPKKSILQHSLTAFVYMFRYFFTHNLKRDTFMGKKHWLSLTLGKFRVMCYTSDNVTFCGVTSMSQAWERSLSSHLSHSFTAVDKTRIGLLGSDRITDRIGLAIRLKFPPKMVT